MGRFRKRWHVSSDILTDLDGQTKDFTTRGMRPFRALSNSDEASLSRRGMSKLDWLGSHCQSPPRSHCADRDGEVVAADPATLKP